MQTRLKTMASGPPSRSGLKPKASELIRLNSIRIATPTTAPTIPLVSFRSDADEAEDDGQRTAVAQRVEAEGQRADQVEQHQDRDTDDGADDPLGQLPI